MSTGSTPLGYTGLTNVADEHGDQLEAHAQALAAKLRKKCLTKTYAGACPTGIFWTNLFKKHGGATAGSIWRRAIWLFEQGQ